MKDRCAELGLTLVETTTPDPMSDAGTSGTQQFILEDVPRAVDQYGTETAFFGTNTAQQEPMIKCVVDTKSYFTYPSDPSPFVGFPAALGIEVPEDKLYDTEYMMNAISEKLAEADMSGHMHVDGSRDDAVHDRKLCLCRGFLRGPDQRREGGRRGLQAGAQ